MATSFVRYKKLGIWTVSLIMAAGFAWAAPEAETTNRAAESISHAIWTAAIAAIVGGFGWIAAYILNSRRDDRTKRIELTIEQTSTQLREFYAPLVALTEQLGANVVVKETTVVGKKIDEEREISESFYHDYFLPIHEEINQILKSKVHLIEGYSIPDSFNLYFKHFSTEKVYWDLIEKKKNVSNIKVPPYPDAFYYDVRRGHNAVFQRYEASVRELQHRPWRLWQTVPPEDKS
jgi:hypothetical protein